jgi:hypothetical protein
MPVDVPAVNFHEGVTWHDPPCTCCRPPRREPLHSESTQIIRVENNTHAHHARLMLVLVVLVVVVVGHERSRDGVGRRQDARGRERRSFRGSGSGTRHRVHGMHGFGHQHFRHQRRRRLPHKAYHTSERLTNHTSDPNLSHITHPNVLQITHPNVLQITACFVIKGKVLENDMTAPR